MTETQAQPGPADSPTAPAASPTAPAESATAPAGANEQKEPAADAGGGEGAATGRAAVGRATVGAAPAVGEGPSMGPGPGHAPGAPTPKYTRAPGMPPPPDVLVTTQPIDGGGPAARPVSAPPTSAPPVVSGTAPVVPGPAVARASVRPPSTASMRTAGIATAPARMPGGTAATARVSEAVRTARAGAPGAARGPRRARLHLKRIDPWSVMKFSFAVSLVLFVVAIVATAVLYLALDAMGVFASVNKALADMVGANGGEAKGGFTITAKGVIGGAALLGAVNVVLFTALATLGAFIYNVCADLVGGVELTLAEKD
jgi:Transmembrane domain of unknown function (DUF3566)